MKNIVAYLFALFIVSSFATQAQWIQLGQNINGEIAGDRSGRSVSLSSNGSVVAIGSPYNDGAGHVRIYQNINGTWTQIGNDINGEAVGDKSGNSVSLSSNGSVVAIGAPYNDGAGNDAGHVRIYQNLNGTWTQIGNDIDGETAGDKSGTSVSLSSNGTVIAIGAPYNNEAGNYAGHVRIYQDINGTWTQIGNDINGTDRDDSGYSVSLSSDGSIVAIGAPSANYDSGLIRIYQNIDESWVQVGQDIDGVNWGLMGVSISLSSEGSVVATGVPFSLVNGRWSGLARVFQNINGTWIKIGQDILAGMTGNLAGVSVSLSSDGSILAIGAPSNSSTVPSDDMGFAKIYQNLGGTWTQIGQRIESEILYDGDGYAVSLSSDGSIVAVGAPFNDANGSNSGCVRVYKNDSLVGIPEISKSEIHIYPNPTKGIINLKFSNDNSVQVFIYDIAGRIIYNNQLLMHNNQLQIDLSSFKNGIYIIKIQSDNNLYTTRIVKE